jgi:hypothetical protein
MSARRIVAIAATGALALGGASAAIAAVSKDPPGKTEDAVLTDAAKRLDVTPDKLRAALKAAQSAELDKKLDAAVKAGDLTRKQADEIKQARERSGSVLGGPPLGGPGVRGLHRRFGPGLGGPGLGRPNELSKALGISERELFTRLRAGKSIAAIAKAEGKSLDDVRSALKAAAKNRLDKAVTVGKLTRKQADAILAHLDERLTHLDRVPRRRFLFRAPDEKMAPPGELKQGRFMPEAPTAAQPPGVTLR